MLDFSEGNGGWMTLIVKFWRGCVLWGCKAEEPSRAASSFQNRLRLKVLHLPCIVRIGFNPMLDRIGFMLSLTVEALFPFLGV